MKLIITFLAIAVILISCSSSSDNNSPATGKGTVTGIVQLLSTNYLISGVPDKPYTSKIDEMDSVKIVLYKGNDSYLETVTNKGSFVLKDVPSGTYKVRAVIGGNVYKESAVFTLGADASKTLDPIVISDFASDKKNLWIDWQLPNPYTTSTMVYFSSSNPVDIALDVFDLWGKKMQNTINIAKELNVSQQVIDGQFPAGIYFVQIQGGSNYAFAPIIKQ
jgi:hypothetical protein